MTPNVVFSQYTYPRSSAPFGLPTARYWGAATVVAPLGPGMYCAVPCARPANGENAAQRKYILAHARTSWSHARTHTRISDRRRRTVVFIFYTVQRRWYSCIKWRRQTIRQRRVTPPQPPQPVAAAAAAAVPVDYIKKKKNKK